MFELAGIVSALCAFTDFKYRKILNKVTFPTILLGIIYWALVEGFKGVMFSGTGLLVGGALLIIPFYLGGIGAGDVKMLAMIGALTGPVFVFQAFIWGAILGAVFALFYIYRLGGSRKDYMPYGIPIAIGVIIQILFEVGII